MTGLVRARYTLEFKEEAVRLVLEGQTVSSMAKTLIFRIRRCITGSRQKRRGHRVRRIGNANNSDVSMPRLVAIGESALPTAAPVIPRSSGSAPAKQRARA